MANIDEEDIHHGLGWSDDVLCQSNKLDNGMVELSTHPSVSGLITDLLPVEQQNLIGYVAHAAPPAMDGINTM